MEAKIGENGGRSIIEGSVDAEKENEEVLKKMIASHPLYGLLIESHLNCMKVGLGEVEEFDAIKDAWKRRAVDPNPKASSHPSSSELDHFMEAYCMALGKLKESMEKPAKESRDFINAMYIQLKDLNEPDDPQVPLMFSKNLEDDSSC